MCYYNDGDYATIYRDTVRRARRDHRCLECRDGIAQGDRYLETTYLYDGSWGVDRTCLRCEYDIYRIFCRERAEGCRWEERFPAPGELGEALGDLEWERTRREAVPEGFVLTWRVDEWAAECRELLGANAKVSDR